MFSFCVVFFNFLLDLTQTICVAARIHGNGSYRLETHFCKENLKALCHRTEHIYNGILIYHF